MNLRGFHYIAGGVAAGAVVALTACGGQAPAETTPASAVTEPADDPEESEPVAKPERVVYIELELDDLMNVRDPGSDQTRVSLVTRDASGELSRHVLGVFPGVCRDVAVGSAEAGLPDPALTGADCTGGARETRVRVLREATSLVALRAWIDGDDGEFPSFDELERVEVEAGARIVVGAPGR